MQQRETQDHDIRDAWSSFSSANEFIGKFPGASSTFIAAAPPVFEDTIGTPSHIIGLCQSFNINQGQQVSRFFELGSRGNFLAPGRGAGSAAASAVVFAGPTLLGQLYPDVLNEEVNTMFRKPGYDGRFTNLQSELFTRPFGLFVMMMTPSMELVASNFLEVCYVKGSQFGVSAQGNIIVTNVTFDYQDMIPVEPDNPKIPGAV